MSVIKILIIEDDFVFAENLKERLIDFGYVISGQASNAADALIAFKKMIPDLVLLDIDLGANEKDGIFIAHEFNKIHSVPIVYLTAFSDKVIIERVKATSPAAFLVKPSNAQQLMATLEVAVSNFSQQIIPVPSNRRVASPESDFYPMKDFFFLRDSNRVLRKILVADILFVEAKGSAVEINLTHSKTLIHANLSSFQQQIAHLHLIRCHRSYLVNLSKIEAIDESVLLIQEHTIPISKSYRDKVFRQLTILKAD